MADFYVYFLIDPRDGATFYVGKGRGDRIKAHAAEVRNGRWKNGAKCRRIADILSAGLCVVEHIHAADLSEGDAYALERRLIREMDGLTNISHGTVTAEQAAIEQLRHLRANLKTFAEWITTTEQKRLDGARAAYGDLRAFYDRFVAEMDREIENPVREFTVVMPR